MSKFIKTIIIIIFLIVYIYICNIECIPSNIILFEGEKINFKTILGLSIKKKDNSTIMQTSSNIDQALEKKTGKINLELNLFNSISLKDMTVNVIPKTKVVPIGGTIGLKLYTKGILVVGMSEISGKQPYQNSGIKEGDTIISVNQKEIHSTAELIEAINTSNGKDVVIEYLSNEEVKTTIIQPSKDNQNEYKLGLWVRDAAAGVGTITYYEPSTQNFAALGHGIQDIDTGKLITISNGEIVTAEIASIQKGERGNPGEIKGNISLGKAVGQITKNTNFGIYGKLNDITLLDINNENAIEVATREEIKTGKAKIICSLENNKKEEFEIEIEKVFTSNNENNKSMQIRVTDPKLIEITGGIIQRNEWKPYYSKREICWCCNTCISK